MWGGSIGDDGEWVPIPSDGGVADIVFEFAGSGRLEILRALEAGKPRFTELSKVVETSSGELSRHLNRLADAGLVAKDRDGAFELTPLASGLLAFLPGIEVLAKHRDFLKTHSLAFVPHHLLIRFDELSGATMLVGPLQISRAIHQMRDSIEKFACALGPPTGLAPGPDEFAMVRQVLERLRAKGGRVRLLLNPGFMSLIMPVMRIALRGIGEVRKYRGPAFGMMVNDAGGLVIFSGHDGKVDAGHALHCPDEQARKWCLDLFEHHWAATQERVDLGEAEQAGLEVPAKGGKR